MISIVCGNISSASACPYQRVSGGRLRPILRPCRIVELNKIVFPEDFEASLQYQIPALV